jgi:hypothetical protein
LDEKNEERISKKKRTTKKSASFHLSSERSKKLRKLPKLKSWSHFDIKEYQSKKLSIDKSQSKPEVSVNADKHLVDVHNDRTSSTNENDKKQMNLELSFESTKIFCDSAERDFDFNPLRRMNKSQSNKEFSGIPQLFKNPKSKNYFSCEVLYHAKDLPKKRIPANQKALSFSEKDNNIENETENEDEKPNPICVGPNEVGDDVANFEAANHLSQSINASNNNHLSQSIVARNNTNTSRQSSNHLNNQSSTNEVNQSR